MSSSLIPPSTTISLPLVQHMPCPPSQPPPVPKRPSRAPAPPASPQAPQAPAQAPLVARWVPPPVPAVGHRPLPVAGELVEPGKKAGMLEENRLVLFHGNKAGSFLAFGGVDPFRFPWFCLMAIGSGRKGCNLTRVQKRMGKENGKKMGLFALSASVSKKFPPSTIDIMTYRTRSTTSPIAFPTSLAIMCL